MAYYQDLNDLGNIYYGGKNMYIKPINGRLFTKKEILQLFKSTINNIVREANNNKIFNICTITYELYRLKMRNDVEIALYKSINDKYYILIDASNIKVLNDGTIEHMGAGPIILDINNKDQILVACGHCSDIVFNMQRLGLDKEDKLICNSTMSTICEETEEDNTNIRENINEGEFKDIQNIASQIYAKISNLNTDYMFIDFILNKPRIISRLAINRVYKEDQGVYFYSIVNVDNDNDDEEISNVYDSSRFIKIFDKKLKLIYDEFREQSYAPAVKIKYFSINISN